MSKAQNIRPIEFHQLCAIARTVLQADPAIDDSEWKERTKAKLSKQGYDYPQPDMMTRVLVSVEHALKQTLGPRPVQFPVSAQKPSNPQQEDPPWKGSHRPKGWTLVSALVSKLQAPSGFRPSSESLRLPTATETLEIAEDEALDMFWHIAGSDMSVRLTVLRMFAEVAIVRPSGWDPERVRDEAGQHRLSADRCFACQSELRRRDWHHVIQIQHGGSNTSRNRVALCGPCHSDVHPWLTPVSREDDLWPLVHVGELIRPFKQRVDERLRKVGAA